MTLDSDLPTQTLNFIIPSDPNNCRVRAFEGGWGGWTYLNGATSVTIPTSTAINRVQLLCDYQGIAGTASIIYQVIWQAGSSSVLNASTNANGASTPAGGGVVAVSIDFAPLEAVLQTTMSEFDLDMFSTIVFAALFGLGIGVSGGMVYRAVRRAS